MEPSLKQLHPLMATALGASYHWTISLLSRVGYLNDSSMVDGTGQRAPGVTVTIGVGVIIVNLTDLLRAQG
jgi:hypothetical protein